MGRILKDVLGVQRVQGSWNGVHHRSGALSVLTVTATGVVVDFFDFIEDEGSTNDDDNGEDGNNDHGNDVNAVGELCICHHFQRYDLLLITISGNILYLN